jgi:type II secretory pathway pseudopilin PulG
VITVRLKSRIAAFTLIELTIVMAIIIILAAISIPALSNMTAGASTNAARTMLRSAFSSARAKAAASQAYVGVRFQQTDEGKTYAVFVEPVPEQTASFLVLQATSQTEPIALPDGVELIPNMDGIASPDDYMADHLKELTTFTVLFAPDGRIIRKRVQVRRRTFPSDPRMYDVIFNNPQDPNVADYLLLEDRYLPLDDPTTEPPVDNYNEISQVSLMIYEQEKRKNAGQTPYTGYVRAQALRQHLNVYTGDLVRGQQEP